MATYRQLFPGHYVDLDVQGEYDHFVGGELDWDGGECPHCNKPFVLHLTLDLADPRVELPFLDAPSLPLFYCQRCEIGDEPLVYRLQADRRIELLSFYISEELRSASAREWRRDLLPDVFRRRAISLRPMRDRLVELFAKANTDVELSDEEEGEAGVLAGTRNWSGDPFLTRINQVGGIPYFRQPIKNPVCDVCREQGVDAVMGFVACLINSESKEWDYPPHVDVSPHHDQFFTTTFDGCQLVFFCCPQCGANWSYRLW